ncbi:hypothetical protein ACVI1L_004868 [Bradyrhizobium sp. USDA 4516]
MTNASIDLQHMRRRLYVKAKAESSWRFWGLPPFTDASYVCARPKVDGIPVKASQL